MPEFGLGIIGWIIIGFLAGALSGIVVRDRTAGGKEGRFSLLTTA